MQCISETLHQGVTMYRTKRQKEILDFIDRFITGNGYAPSIGEIGRSFGLSSPATVHKHLAELQRKGMIRKTWNRRRSRPRPSGRR